MTRYDEALLRRRIGQDDAYWRRYNHALRAKRFYGEQAEIYVCINPSVCERIFDRVLHVHRETVVAEVKRKNLSRILK